MRCSKPTGGCGPTPGFCARTRSSSRCAEASYAAFCWRLSSAVGASGISGDASSSSAVRPSSWLPARQDFPAPPASAPPVRSMGAGGALAGCFCACSSLFFRLHFAAVDHFKFRRIAHVSMFPIVSELWRRGQYPRSPSRCPRAISQRLIARLRITADHSQGKHAASTG